MVGENGRNGSNGWNSDIRNLIIFKSPGHLMGGAKDKHRYLKLYYMSEEYLIWLRVSGER